MVQLLQTNNVSMARRLSYFGEDYYEIPAVGDGNCALNSMALGLIDLIKRDQLQLDQYRQDKWAEVTKATVGTLQARLKLYRSDSMLVEKTPYEDLADGLEKFIQLLQQNDFSYALLLKYIKENSENRLQIAVLHIALAPALRYIGAVLYKQQLEKIGMVDPTLLADAEALKQDYAWAGHEILMPLAREFFRVNLIIQDNVQNTVYEEDAIVDAPTVNIVRVVGHWNYCVPAKQNDGVAAVLPPPVAVINPDATAKNLTWSLEETHSLIEVASSIARDMVARLLLTIAQLKEARLTLKNAVKNLLSLGDEKGMSAEVKQLVVKQEANTATIMKAVRGQCDLSDEKIKSYKLNDLQKQVLRGEYQSVAADPSANSDILDDERLARSLQEVEVLSFLNKKGWSRFFRKPDAHIAKPVNVVPSAGPSPAIVVK